MNKTELIDALATKMGSSKAVAGNFLDAYQETIATELARGGEVVVTGFGSFSAKDRAARTGRNPRTGEPLEIAAARLPVFKAGKTFKDAVALK